MSQLIQIVARAMCRDLGINPDDWSEDEGGNRVHAWQNEAGTARVAIEAVHQHLVPRNAAVSRQFTREFEALMEAALSNSVERN